MANSLTDDLKTKAESDLKDLLTDPSLDPNTINYFPIASMKVSVGALASDGGYVVDITPVVQLVATTQPTAGDVDLTDGSANAVKVGDEKSMSVLRMKMMQHTLRR